MLEPLTGSPEAVSSGPRRAGWLIRHGWSALREAKTTVVPIATRFVSVAVIPDAGARRGVVPAIGRSIDVGLTLAARLAVRSAD
jgi:hypothetical protein